MNHSVDVENPSHPSSRAVVVFIGGYGRSGSTLLERILARLPGVIAAGELCFFWDRGLRQAQLCGCGAPLPSCPFWSRVLQHVFDGDGPGSLEQILTWQREVRGIHNLHCVRKPWLQSQVFSSALSGFRETLASLYLGLSSASGGAMIVDSSKDPVYAEILAGIPAVDLRLIHMVRDSRAVAHSWQRKRQRPEIHWREELMPRFSIPRSAVAWSVKNAAMTRLRGRLDRSCLLRYEDLMEAPARELERISNALDLPGSAALNAELREGKFSLEVDHTAAGNPIRFETGPLVLQRDEEWQSGMPTWRKSFITAITGVGLHRYGYLG
jgi:hypothetical protein